MPYVVLARRWRPQLFKDVVGQEHVTRTLQNAISANRIAHAYLFSGPRGVGKTTVARILAKAVNCMEGTQSEPCGKCNICKEISASGSIDVIEMDAASNRRIDEIRELIENVKFSPVSGRYKVYIIDEAHMLTTEAFNALLKTLEEPPGHVIFILATTEPHKIPLTILSRCQRFDFRMLARQEIVDRLKKLAAADNISIDDEALSMIAESADGSLRDAESLFDQLLSFGSGEIQTEGDELEQVHNVGSDTVVKEEVSISNEEVSKLLGFGAYHLLDQLVGNIIQNDTSESLKTLSELAEHGADLSQCLKKLISYFRDLMVYKVNPDLIDAPETKLQQLAKHSEAASIDKFMKIARIFAQTESDIKQLGYERLNLELSLVKLSRLKDGSIPLDEVLGKLEEIESKLASGSVTSVSAVAESEPIYRIAAASIEEEAEEEQVENADEESDPLRATWLKLLDAVKEKESPMHHAFLKEASPISISDDCLTIDFLPKFNWHREQVQEPETRKAVETQLSKLMGKPMRFKVKDGNSPDSDEETEQESSRSQRDMQLDAQQDESVRLVLDVFDGRVVEVKK